MKPIVYLLGAVVLALCMAGCREDSRRVAVQVGALNGPGGLSLVKLLEEDCTRVEGLSMQYTIKNDPTLIVAMLVREDLDVALVPFTTGALLYNKGLPYQLAAVPVWGSLYLVGEDTSITQLEDIRGKTVFMMAKNMTPDIIFRHILMKAGLDPERDLTIDYTFSTPTELASALQGNRAPLGLVSEPMVSHILMENTKMHVLLDIAASWNGHYGGNPPLAQTALMVRKSWAQQHPKLVESWCRQYARAIRWTNTHPDRAATLAVRHGIVMHRAAAVQAIPRCRLDFKRALSEKDQILQYLALLYSMNPKIIGNKIPDDGFFYAK